MNSAFPWSYSSTYLSTYLPSLVVSRDSIPKPPHHLLLAEPTHAGVAGFPHQLASLSGSLGPVAGYIIIKLPTSTPTPPLTSELSTAASLHHGRIRACPQVCPLYWDGKYPSRPALSLDWNQGWTRLLMRRLSRPELQLQ